MKVVYSGAFHETSTNYSQARELSKVTDCDLIEYPCKVRAGEIGAYLRDKELIELVRKEVPDFVLFAKGTGMGIDVLKECNKVSKTCIWWMDAFPHGNWDAEHVERLKQASFVCCDKVQAVNEAKKYCKNVFRLCEGYDQTIDIPYKLPKVVDVSFIGGIYGTRHEMCLAANAHTYNNAYGNLHAQIVSSTKINLNSCTHNCASDRVYKILAAKGFLLTDDWEGREFIHGKHLVVYNGIKDLQDKVEYYLEHEDERETIAAAGHEEVQKYSRKHWAANLIEIYNSIDF
jgi:hypothetical protein